MSRNLKPIDHGTRNGYVMHIRRGEKACDECADANYDYCRDYRATNRATYTPRHRAVQLLIDNHRDEFKECYKQIRRQVLAEQEKEHES